MGMGVGSGWVVEMGDGGGCVDGRQARAASATRIATDRMLRLRIVLTGPPSWCMRNTPERDDAADEMHGEELVEGDRNR